MSSRLSAALVKAHQLYAQHDGYDEIALMAVARQLRHQHGTSVADIVQVLHSTEGLGVAGATLFRVLLASEGLGLQWGQAIRVCRWVAGISIQEIVESLHQPRQEGGMGLTTATVLQHLGPFPGANLPPQEISEAERILGVGAPVRLPLPSGGHRPPTVR